MKIRRLLFGLLAAALLFSVVSCDDDDDFPIVSFASLPTPAQQFLRTYYDVHAIQVVYYYNQSFQVVFPDARVDFTKTGDWVQLSGTVPLTFQNTLPAAMLGYLQANYPGYVIQSIERTPEQFYHVTLSAGESFWFDASGNPVEV